MSVTFTEPSPEGVPPPEPPAGLPPVESQSPARRSPTVRAAQALNSRRPDRLGKQPADLV